jgi:hypothetical protein
MAAYNMKEISWKDIGQVFAAEPEIKPERLCAYSEGDDIIVAEWDTFTVVMNRNIQRSIEISTGMALHIAKKYNGGNVLLVNTYASTELLQQSIARALFHSGQKLPHSYFRFFPETWIVDRDFDDSATPQFPPNLRLLDCPASSLSLWRLEQALDEYQAETIILNSFEFASLARQQRMVLAEGLLELREKRGLSVIIFSHEMKADIAPYTPGRGALGLLSAFAGSVLRLMTPYEKKQWYYMVKCGKINGNTYM